MTYLYAIGRFQGPIKIGFSNFPDTRLSALQSGCPFKLELIYVRECRDRAYALNQERIIHKVYQKFKLSGEWFKIDAEVATEAIDTAIEIADHFESQESAD